MQHLNAHYREGVDYEVQDEKIFHRTRLSIDVGQPRQREEPLFRGRLPTTARWFANGWHEPYESRGSRTDLWGTGGAIPPVYPAGQI